MPPPDRYVFDWETPSAKVDIEAMRLATRQALADLVGHEEQLADSFLLGQTAADFAQTVLDNFTAMTQAVTAQAAALAALRADLDALAAQVAALTPTPPEVSA